jgi:quaternary ammonium compound-resistance protein SugE
MSIYWMVLFAAVLVEIAWALSMKWVQMNPGWLSIGCAGVLTVTNMAMLSYAMRGIPVGTAYAVWTGLGAAGVTLFGVLWFHDPATWAKFAFTGLIILGVIGLKYTSA